MELPSNRRVLLVILGLCSVQRVRCQIDPSQAEDCVSGPSNWYRGTRSVTKDGTPCQRWDVNEPHLVVHRPKGNFSHNYCRNPDSDIRGLWCYSTNKTAAKFHYCGIPKCKDDSLLLYTTRDYRGNNWIAHYPADPEVGFYQPSHNIYNTSGTSFVWALASNKREEQVFFTDYKVNHFGVLSLATNETRYYMEGMCHGIEEIAYDFVSGNLYWTDSSKRWLMVADRNFEYFVKLYKNQSEEPFGLALHAGKRRIYFSLYEEFTPSIKMANMDGTNVTTLFQESAVHEVPSLTLDYTDDRLYWISNNNPRTFIMSSNLDGGNLTLIYSRQVGRFWGIAAYMSTLYLADQIGYYDAERGRYYRLWILTKTGLPRQSFKTSTKTKSLSIYSTNEEYIPPYEETTNGCKPNNPCDQLCIPLIGNKYSCGCSLGYTKIETKCHLDHAEDNFLLMVDVALKTMFQISFDDDIKNFAALNIPTTFDESVTAITLDSATKIIYWYDRKQTAIYRSDFLGLTPGVFRPDVHANTMAVDPKTGNLYYVDDDSGYLYVVDKTGAYSKVLYKPSDSELSKNHIEDISLDLENKHIYWTAIDITTNEDDDKNAHGTVMRAGLDGSSSEVVLHNILTPRVIFVDNKSGKLFLGSNGNVIYEILLSSLKNITGLLPANRKRHNIRGASQSNPIVDFFIRGSYGYMIGRSSPGVVKFSLKNPGSQRDFGSSDFFQPQYLSMYDSTYQKQYSTPPPKCATLQCEQLCLQRPEGGAVCQCGDNYRESENKCIQTNSDIDDIPPTYGNSCPRNLDLEYMYCKLTISLPPWDPPVWTDNKTPSDKLEISAPTIASEYTSGTHSFLYTATDESDNVGQCFFTVTIKRSLCILKAPPRYLGVRISSSRCDNGDIVHPIRCKNKKKWVRYGSWLNQTIYNLCLPTLKWSISNYSQLSCEYPTTTASPITATKPSTATPSITTTKLPVPDNSPTPQSVSSTTVRPSPSIKTITLTSPTTSSPSPSAKQPITKQLPVATQPITDNDVSNMTNKVGDARKMAASVGLSAGVVVVIVLVIILVIAAVATAFVCIKKRHVLPPSMTRVRMMWSRSNDQGLTNSSSEDYHKF